MEIDIVRFNATTATEDDWKKYHIFRKLRYKETNPEDSMTPDSLIEKAFKMQENHPEMDGERYVIYETGQLNKIIGNLSLLVFRETSASYKGNEQISQFELALLRESRRMGIGTQVMKMAYEFVKQKGRSIMITNTSEASGRAFLNKIGGTEALSGVENRLDLGQVDWTELKNWSKEGAIRAPGVTLKTFNLVPDEIIDEYCRIYTETMNQQPFGDLEISDLVTTPESLRLRENQFKEMGGSSIIYISKETDGTISGLTELIHFPAKETFAMQGLTGVKAEFRGRGLGKWLKAEALLKLKNQFPKVKIITTDNATTNGPMLEINEKLGFVEYKKDVISQIKLEKLEKFLFPSTIINTN